MRREKVGLVQIEDPRVRAPGNLARSMGAVGQLVPVILWRNGDGTYRIADGRRRVAAARKLGWERIDALILQTEGEAELAAARVTIAGNVHSPNPLSEAEAVGVLGEESAIGLGLTPAQARARARLARLHPRVREAIERGEIPRGAAGALAKVPRDRQVEVLERAGQARAGKRIRIEDVRRAARAVRAEIQPDFLALAAGNGGGLEPRRPDWREYAVRAAALLDAIIREAPEGLDLDVLRKAKETLAT